MMTLPLVNSGLPGPPFPPAGAAPAHRARRPDGAQVRVLLDRAVQFPALAARYRWAADGPVPEFEELEPLSGPELRAALWQRVREGLLGDRGARLYLGGGTAARPAATVLPPDLFAADILQVWQPLRPTDVVVNLARGNRFAPQRDLCDALARLSGCSVIPYSRPQDQERTSWLGFLEQAGATALAVDTATLRELLQFCRQRGRSLDWVSTLVWVGAGIDRATAELVAQLLPAARVWGLYGSVDCWAVGTQSPRCPRDVVHLLPYQYVELCDGELLVTTLHPAATVPVIRYRTGDGGRFTECPCGVRRPAVRLTGQLDEVLTFRGSRFHRTELAELACGVAEVAAAEVAVLDRGLPTERLRWRITAADGELADHYLEDWVLEHLLSSDVTLAQMAGAAPDAIEVVAQNADGQGADGQGADGNGADGNGADARNGARLQ
jgi:phenylacetate-CoA ligase